MSTHPFTTSEARNQLAPRGDTPSLARLAYNRLGFGPLASSPDFNDTASLTAYVDAQLNTSAIDDSECENYIAGFNRTFTATGTGGVTQTTTLPPPNSSLRDLQAWANSLPAGASGSVYAARFLRAHTYARATLSKRQLYEVMVDFWSNHFNTLADNTHTKYWEDYAVIRRYALGNFRDLIGASAKSPTMLLYLSNYANDGNNPNENYARELLELHTLGTTNRVPGDTRFGQPNYSEDDVHQLAYLLSGWTYAGSTANEFNFTPSMHNYGGRSLYLGNPLPTYFPNGGIEQAEAVLDQLSEDSRLAYRLSLKLCQRFISDDPVAFCPNVIVDGQTAFLSSHGDIKTTLRAILLANHPGADFKSSFGQKIKRPFEFYASALRALGTDTTSSAALFDIAQNGDLSTYTSALDQILFGCPPPTGYPDTMDAWWSTNQLFSRLSLANRVVRFLFGELDTGGGAINPAQNARLDAVLGVTNGVGPNSAGAVDMLVQKFIGRSVAANDRQSLITYLNISNNSSNITSTNNKVRQLIGTLLASPYFQYR